MKKHGKIKWGKLKKCYVLIGIFLLVCILPATGGNFRNIASVIYSYYFNDTFRVDSNDVFLVHVFPGVWLKADIARVDAGSFDPAATEDAGWYNLMFAIGPVINFTKTFYMDAVYGIGFDSTGKLMQKGDINFTHETESSTISFGARIHYFINSEPENESEDDYYFLPSMSGSVYPIPELRLFCKLFFSRDKAGVISGSMWGEGGWSFTSLFSANAGFTLSYRENEFGYSVIGGFKLNFTETISLKYFCQYLSNAVEYLTMVSVIDGIANGIIFDMRF